MKVSASLNLPPVAWDYDRGELVADAVVHILGIVLAIAGAAGLIAILVEVGSVARLPSVTIYVAALVSMLGFSAAYNLWPVSELKWWLRRLDHSAIYLLIAATYTAFLSPMQGAAPAGALAAIWSAALAGMAIKLIWPGRFDRTSVAIYLILGWSGIFLIGPTPPRSHRRRLFSSSSVACFIRVVSCSTRGGDCASRTRSGTDLCLAPRSATTAQSFHR
jgi:channel protein (hemolysin III family)